jgi:hypothetical protein
MSTAQRRFTRTVLAELRRASYLRIRAGQGAHRFTAIWVVVVEGRAFIRSWSQKPGGWYQTFRMERQGAIRLGEREISVQAMRTRSERLLAAVDQAYREKYTTPASAPFARGLGEPARRATTTELVPNGRGRAARAAAPGRRSRLTTR